MSVNPTDAPTPDSLEDSFHALNQGPAVESTAPVEQPVENTPATTEAAPDEQQPGESAIDYKARVAELEETIRNRDWSSQGRYLKEQKRAEALAARVKELEEGYGNEDTYRQSLYDQAIANAPDERERSILTRERDAELRDRKAAREAAAAAATGKITEAEKQADQQTVYAYHENVIRNEALPELAREADRLAQRYELPPEEVASLRATFDTKANRLLLQNAPPQFIGAWALEQVQELETRAQAAQERVVARNRQQASEAGTYRGTVSSATAPSAAPTGRNTAIRDIDDLAEAFMPQSG